MKMKTNGSFIPQQPTKRQTKFAFAEPTDNYLWQLHNYCRQDVEFTVTFIDWIDMHEKKAT